MQDKFKSAIPTMTVTPGGDKEWRNRDGELHRDDGPAIEYADGTTKWFRNGLLHRDDGPAVERPNAGKFWYREGKLHRDDGPAIEYEDAVKQWWIDGRELNGAEIAALQRKRQQQEQQCQSATAIQAILRSNAPSGRTHLKKPDREAK